jgi:hypothetical protein
VSWFSKVTVAPTLIVSAAGSLGPSSRNGGRRRLQFHEPYVGLSFGGLGSTAQRIYQTVGGGCDPEEDEQQRAYSNQDFCRRGIGFLCFASFVDPISPTVTSRNLDFVVGENARPRHGKGVVDVGHGDLRWKRDTKRLGENRFALPGGM